MPKKRKKRGHKRVHSRPPSNFEVRQDIIRRDDTFQYNCTRCGKCCHRVKGAVPVDSLDIFHMAQYLEKIGHPCEGDIATIINEMADVYCLSPISGLPIFTLRTESQNQKCIFLDEGNTCLVQDGKPRACRLYPLSVQPNASGDELDILIVSRRKHHFTGPHIRAGDWISQTIDEDDVAFSLAEPHYVLDIERRLRLLRGTSQYEAALARLMMDKYFFFDLEAPFMPQYRANMKRLLEQLDAMIRAL